LSIRGFWFVTAALALVLLGAGCGGSDDSATGSSGGEVTVETGSLSKAAFIKRANKICVDSKRQFFGEFGAFLKEQQENPPKPTGETPEEIMVNTLLVPNFQRQIDKISALGAPSGDEEQVSAFLNAFQQATDEANEDPLAFIASKLDLGNMPKLANAYGLSFCDKPNSNEF